MTITLGPIPKLIKTIKFFSFYLIKVDIFGLPVPTVNCHMIMINKWSSFFPKLRPTWKMLESSIV